MNIERQHLQRKLGHNFNDDALLELALSHRSVGAKNNERLEFLGDSLVNHYMAEALFHKFPSAREGQLSRLRAELVKGDTLAAVAREMNVGSCLLLGGGELKSGGYRRDSILADAVEALIAAIYLDAGDSICRDLVLNWFAGRLERASLKTERKDAKTRLQEFLQSRKKPLPLYEVVSVSGGSHDPHFVISCSVEGLSFGVNAEANSRKAAEQLAAQLALDALGVS